MARTCVRCGGSSGRIVCDCGIMLHASLRACVRHRPELYAELRQIRMEAGRPWADLYRALRERIRPNV